MQASMVKCYDPHRELLLAIVNCDKSRMLRSLPIDPHMYWHLLPIKSLKRVSRIRNASTSARVKLNPNPHDWSGRSRPRSIIQLGRSGQCVLRIV